MVDTVRPPKSGRAAKAPAPRAKTPTLPKTGQSSLPIFVIGVASVLLVSLGVALYLWWAPVIDAAVQVWEALRYTYVALAVWLVAFPVTLNRRSDLVKRFPPLLGLGAADGPRCGGVPATVRTGTWRRFWRMDRWLQRHVGHRPHRRCICRGPRNRGARARALCLGKLTLIGLGFLAVYAWDALGHVMRWIQAAGVWIGMKCTEVSPSLARAFAAVWRGICAVYSKAPRPRLLLGGRGDYWQLRSAAPRRGTSTTRVHMRTCMRAHTTPTRTRKASSTMWVPTARRR